MQNITLENANYFDLDQTVNAVAWYGTLDDIQRYIAVYALTKERGLATYDMISDAITYIAMTPDQTDFNPETLRDLATKLILRGDAEGWL